jgi:hypothetical protein
LWGSPSTGGRIIATVSESVSSRCTIGYYALTDASHSSTSLNLFHSVATGNLNGLEADGVGAVITVAQSMVIENFQNVNGNGIVQSFGDNYLDKPTSLTNINKQ